MASLNGFNANEVDPAADFEAVPPGEYTAIITESETKPTKAGRSEEHTSELQSLTNLVCRLLLEKKKKKQTKNKKQSKIKD